MRVQVVVECAPHPRKEVEAALRAAEEKTTSDGRNTQHQTLPSSISDIRGSLLAAESRGPHLKSQQRDLTLLVEQTTSDGRNTRYRILPSSISDIRGSLLAAEDRSPHVEACDDALVYEVHALTEETTSDSGNARWEDVIIIVLFPTSVIPFR